METKYMTPEKQRIAIAEACGWKHGHIEEHSFADPRKSIKTERWISPGGIPQRCCPDYLDDLNAMHEAEKVLGLEGCHKYNGWLAEIVVKPHIFTKEVLAPCFLFHATAAQRAEAFLRAIGKWENDS